MADCNTVGLEEVEKLLLNMDEKATAAVPKMLKAGAQIIVEAQKAEAMAMGINDTGAFVNSIKASSVKGDSAGKHLLIYPQGKSTHGNDYGGGKSKKGNVRYATLGALNEYGTSSQPARPWLSSANAKVGDKANAKMAEVWESLKNG